MEKEYEVLYEEKPIIVISKKTTSKKQTCEGCCFSPSGEVNLCCEYLQSKNIIPNCREENENTNQLHIFVKKEV